MCNMIKKQDALASCFLNFFINVIFGLASDSKGIERKEFFAALPRTAPIEGCHRKERCDKLLRIEGE